MIHPRPLDRIDAAILDALQKNARLSNKELAARVGLAPSSCLARVRRLQEDGAFLGFHADVDPATLGITVQAMVAVRLSRHAREQVESFRAHVLSLPEVVAIFHVTGEADYVLHVAVRDLHHLRELTLSAFTTRPEVAHIETAVVFEHVRKPALPIYSVEDEEEDA
jgi:DNA-binding Lrp family transcriptional regulator